MSAIQVNFSTSDFMLNELASECSSTSDNGSVSNCLSSFSDEEVLLASNNPKKSTGMKKFSETRHPIYMGVRRRNLGKWVFEMREPNKKTRIWLKTFPTPEMAARVHDVPAIALRGRYACLNFFDSAWTLPIPASGETKDIQKAVAEAVEAFRPSMEVDQVVYSEDVNVKEEENVVFVDEDEIFSMSWLITSMAEGLMLPPPVYSLDDEDQEQHLQLWSY